MRAIRQASRPVQQRTIMTAVNAGRQTVTKAMPKATVAAQQVRGVKTVDFAGHKEKVFGTCRMQEWGLELSAGSPDAHHPIEHTHTCNKQLADDIPKQSALIGPRTSSLYVSSDY